MSAPENTPPTGRLVGLPCPGEVLAGKYQVEAVLGVGGMAVVVAARHLELDERVALKILLPKYRNNEELVTRFRREARAAVKIKSQHVARVHDVGTLEDGAPCLVMEFLEGLDLEARLDDQGPLTVEEAVDYLLQACDALAEAHGIGIVHRDLKPANLFLTKSGDGKPVIKLLDFGISKVQGWSLTRKQASFGTPHYMSPEQLRSSDQVDARTDIWSLGAILHELIAGKPAFSGNDLAELQEQIRHGHPTRLRADAPHAPEGLERVIAKALTKPLEERFDDVAELAAALAPFGSWGAVASAESVRRVLEAARERSLSLTDPAMSGGQFPRPPTPIAFMPLPASMVAARTPTSSSSLAASTDTVAAAPEDEAPASSTPFSGVEVLRLSTKTSVAIDHDDATPRARGARALVLGSLGGGALALAALYGVFSTAHVGRRNGSPSSASPSLATASERPASADTSSEPSSLDSGISVVPAAIVAITPGVARPPASTRGGPMRGGTGGRPPVRRGAGMPSEKVFDDRK